MRPLLYISILFLSCCFSAAGVTTIDTVSVHFRQSRIELDTAYAGNGERLDSIFRLLTSKDKGSRERVLKRVEVIGAASPEGSVTFNRYLSEHRAEAITEAFREQGLLNDSVLTTHRFLGRDWNGLRYEVIADRKVPRRSEVLGLLDRITDSTAAVNHPLQRLKAIGEGEPYLYLYYNKFPDLRQSTLILEYALVPQIRMFRTTPSIQYTPAMTGLIEEPFPTVVLPKPCKPFYLGLKTNLLSDVLLVPHIGADLYVGKGWSVTADWMYGWWDRDKTHYYWRAYGGTLGLRKWFGRKAANKPLTGHHLGLYAGAVTYDFELGGTGYMGGLPHGTLWDRCNVITGVEYGYSLPVARRLNIDFSIGVGYLGGTYYKYVPKDGFYIWQSTHRLHWFGPTKAEVSLVWLVGCDNYNRRKGGIR